MQGQVQASHSNSGDIGLNSVVDGIVAVTLYVSHLKADPNSQVCDNHEGSLFQFEDAMDLTKELVASTP